MKQFALWGLEGTAAVVAAFVITLALIAACVGADIFVVQPLTRQDINHGANWCMAQTANITNAYNDYQAAVARLPVDQQALAQFVKDNGNPNGYGFYQNQDYQELQTTVTGDQQAIARLAAAYNAIRDNPDAQTCQASFPAGYPASLPLALPNS